MRNRTGGGKRRGQTLVESVLVLVVAIAMFAGILDFGQVMFLHQSLVERARDAARWGAVNFTDTDAIERKLLYNDPAPRTEDHVNDPGYLGLTPSMVDVVRRGEGTTGDRIVITISNYPFRFFSPWIAGVYQGRTITATVPVEIE